MKRVIAALLIGTLWLSAQYQPPLGNVGGSSIPVTGGNFAVTLTGNTNLVVPLDDGTPQAVVGGDNLSVLHCIPRVANITYGKVSCDAGFTYNGSGVVQQTVVGTPTYSLRNTSGTTETAVFEYQNSTGRQWIHGPGILSSTHTGLTFAEYTGGSFQRTTLYLKKGGTTCIGHNNVECTNATLSIKNTLATTGTTRMLIERGAADLATTVTATNEGTSKSAGYQSSDGSVGVTGATCSSFKNGLCVAP